MLIEVLEDIKKNIAIDDNKSITFDINPISEIITADKDRFHQIIHNLIDNALKFTESGKIELNCHKNEKNLHFNVVDTGIGIPEGEHKRIFERFYKVDPFSSGAGLGLSLSQSIARFMGGNISVESVQGKGSTFEFVFPLK
jgi:signal transduction histidine kinase